MKTCVCGSLTEEINIRRGLKQGYPLAPFLFFLVAEGFGGLMSNAVRLNLFKGFEVGGYEVSVIVSPICGWHLVYWGSGSGKFMDVESDVTWI